jgi:4-methyl-5(b-hydroxyethyl)-thiazole monophosphate biosynthesis
MIAVLLANGFEEIEALTPIDVLRRAGLEVLSCGLNGKRIKGSHGIFVEADLLPEEVKLDEVTMAIFPGGMPGATNIDAHPFTDKAIDAVTKNGGRLAAICAAPLVLGRRGLLDGKRATCYPGFEGELTGAVVTGKGVVTDGSVTTAKGMGVALEFAKELVRVTVGKEKAEEISLAIMEA